MCLGILLKKINKHKKELIEIVKIKGVHHPDTLHHSKKLDDLLNDYQMKTNKQTK